VTVVMGAFESQRRMAEVDPVFKAIRSNVTGFWQSIVTMPGSRFVTGHTYVAVVFGILGNMEPENVNQPPLSATLSIRRGGGTNYGLYNRITMREPRLWRSRTPPGGWNGMPFIFDYTWTQIAGESLEVIGRTEIQNLGDPGARWVVDEINVHAWDVTAIGGVSDMRYFHQSAFTPQPLTSTLAYPIDFTLSSQPAGTWLVYYGAHLTPGEASAASEVRLEDATSGTTRLLTHYLPRLGQLADNEQPIGGFRGVGLGTSFRLKLGVVNQHAVANGTFLRGFVFGVLMPPLTLFGQTTGQDLAPAQADFFGQYGQSNFTSVQHVQAATSYYDTVIAAHACSFLGPVNGQNPSVGFTGFLDVDGGRAHPNYPAILGVYTPNTISFLPVMRGMVYALGGGTHRFRYQGETNPYTLSSYDQKTKAFDVFVCNWSTTYDPIQAIAQPAPGPTIIVVPGREVTLNVSALPLLPFEPHEPLQFELLGGETRGTKFPRRGYEITHSRFLVPYRRFRKTWSLKDADATTLLAFLGALRTTEGCYRWKAPDRPAQKPYRVQGFREAWSGQAGIRRVEAEALELVWFTP